MRRLADRFSESAFRCSSLAELRTLVLGAAQELGFHFVALLHHASLAGRGRDLVRIDNYPLEWAQAMVDGGLAAHDPVHRASRNASAAFEWNELSRLTVIGGEQKRILEQSRRHGIGDGMTVPVNVPGEPSGSCSFAVRSGSALPKRRLLCAELIGLHAFEAARRLWTPLAPSERPRLSRREVQCLRLVCAGKTDWEIGAILGIGVETARQYVKRARAAYDVVSRAQLVVLGLRDHWLSFDDATDPRP